MLKQGVGFCLFCAAEKVWPPGSGCSTRAAAHQHTRHVLLHTRHVLLHTSGGLQRKVSCQNQSLRGGSQRVPECTLHKVCVLSAFSVAPAGPLVCSPVCANHQSEIFCLFKSCGPTAFPGLPERRLGAHESAELWKVWPASCGTTRRCS